MEKEWKTYPVFHLDLNAEKYDSPQALVEILSRQLTQWELKYGKGEDEETLSGRFAGVIRRACEQSGRGVVVLVDEYDKPLLQALDDGTLLDDYRKTLKAFYGVLKSSDRYLRFVFLTGVTKFAQVSVFSDLNQLNDISMKPQYATICGITRQELEDTFIPELNRLAETNELTYEETLNKICLLYTSPGAINSTGNECELPLDNKYWIYATVVYGATLMPREGFLEITIGNIVKYIPCLLYTSRTPGGRSEGYTNNELLCCTARRKSTYTYRRGVQGMGTNCLLYTSRCV